MTGRLVAASHRRPFVVVLGLLVLVAVAISVVVAVGQGRGPSPATGPSPGTGPTSVAAITRLHAIDHLLHARSLAVVDHDKAAFLATIDPQATTFRRRQSRMFADLAAVHFKSWSYAMTAAPRRAPPDAAAYGAPVWAPSFFALRYRLAHFDARPTNLRQYPTFVERNGHWYLASLNDYAPRHLISATDLWDYGKVTVVRRPRVLVLGFVSERETMLGVASDLAAAIPQVTQVWGRHWARRAVALVPRTTREMALIDSDREDLSQIAALTSAEVNNTAGHPAPVGNRITINPQNWPKLSALGRSIVLRHELTHVATQSSTGSQTPTWLSEGFADYVGFKFAGVSAALAGHELQQQVEAGRVPRHLPGDHGFAGSSKQLAVHYEAAWFACRAIAARFGQRALVRFYRVVGRSTGSSSLAVRDALSSVLGLRLTRFVALWRHDIVTELG